MTPEVALAVSPRSWSHELHQFIADHGGARVRTRVLSAEEATAESYDVLVVDDVSSFVTRRLVDRIRSTGRFVLGVYDPSEAPEGKQRLLELGVDDVIESGATPDEFLIAIRALAAERSVAAPAREEQGPDGTSPKGALVTVGGAAGGVGVTEVSVALAARLAGRRETVLIDGDVESPGIAQRLGLALHPSIRTALDTFHHGGGDPISSLQPADGSSLRVLGGLAGRSDWSELRASEVMDLTRQYLREDVYVVANISPGVDGREPGPSPGDIARALVAAADSRVVVADASPVGLTRLLEWLARAGGTIGERPLHVVVNRAPRSAYRRSEVVKELNEAGADGPILFTPLDRRIEEAAWEGAVLRSGPFIRALRPLARAIVENAE